MHSNKYDTSLADASNERIEIIVRTTALIHIHRAMGVDNYCAISADCDIGDLRIFWRERYRAHGHARTSGESYRVASYGKCDSCSVFEHRECKNGVLGVGSIAW